MTLGQYLPDSITDPLDLNNLISEFSVPDSANVSLQDFYLGGSFVPNDPFYQNICNIPESGDISFLDFYKRKSYILSSLKDSADEGDTFSVYLNAQNVPDGSLIPYTISGIDSNDLLFGDMIGNFNILNSSDSISFTILEDSTTEGLESLTVTLQGGINESISISINDTSVLTEFLNYNFSDTTLLFDDGINKGIPYWTGTRSQIRLGIDYIGGFLTPSDPTPNPTGAGGQVSPGDGTLDPEMDFNVTFPSVSGKTTARLISTGTVSADGDVCHGPYLIYNDYVFMSAGSQVTFEWRAVGGDDNYDVFAYLLRDDGYTQILLNETQTDPSVDDTGWLIKTNTVSQSGNYKFVFIGGTFDYSFGQAAGASLYVTEILITE